MDVKKVLFINQEITPYLPETLMGKVGRDLSQGFQEQGCEVRTFMPKYGGINERRNQLHEVIRLSGINLIIDDTDHPLIIKVATLLPSRIQVYFIYNDDYFQRNLVKELETVTSTADNDERSIFFVRGVLETVKKLRWTPDIVQCNGWLTALTPLYIKHKYSDDPSFAKTKVVYALFANQPATPFDIRFAEKLKFDGIPDEDFAGINGKEATALDLAKFAIDNCDGVIQYDPDVDPQILDLVKNSSVPFLPFQADCDFVKATADFYNNL